MAESTSQPVNQSTTAPTWAEISKAALAHNFRGIRERIGPEPEIWPAVKANAYGHGAIIISRWLKELGAAGLCVARAREGQELRDAGLEGPIALLTPFLPEQAEEVLRADLEPVVVRRDQVEALSSRSNPSTSQPINVHVKVDTGMRRVGVTPHEAIEFCRWVQEQPGIRIRGVCSHFPVADEADKYFSKVQIETFFGLAQALRDAGVAFDHAHIANSAGIMDLPGSWATLVRPGIMMYGLEPGPHVSDSVSLQPVMTLKTRVIQVKTIHGGTGVSYGLTWTAPDMATVATLPIGYADGLPRLASNRAEMTVRGRRAAQVGRICMDMCLINVTGIPGVEVGDEVTVWGRRGDGAVTCDEWAAWCETINYEMTTRLGPRVPRVGVD